MHCCQKQYNGSSESQSQGGIYVVYFLRQRLIIGAKKQSWGGDNACKGKRGEQATSAKAAAREKTVKQRSREATMLSKPVSWENLIFLSLEVGKAKHNQNQDVEQSYSKSLTLVKTRCRASFSAESGDLSRATTLAMPVAEFMQVIASCWSCFNSLRQHRGEWVSWLTKVGLLHL